MSDVEKVGQEQIHELLFQEKLSWQSIIYDLINSEQLDPWNIDLTMLSQKYLEKVRLLEEANFFISSKVLLAASLLLRIKSEIVLSQDIPTLDEILFGKKEEKVYTQERIELDGEIPALVPRTPLPRFRRVTLEELMAALGKAIKTETRRIRKEVLIKQQERETAIAMPKNRINVQEQIRVIYSRLEKIFATHEGKLAFSTLIEQVGREDMLAAFVSILHLDNQQKVWLEQEGHFEEIWIWMKDQYERVHSERLEQLRKEVEAFMKEAEKEQEASDAALVDEEDDEPEERTEKKPARKDQLEEDSFE